MEIYCTTGIDNVPRRFMFGKDQSWPRIYEQPRSASSEMWTKRVVEKALKRGFSEEESKELARIHYSTAYYASSRFFVPPAYIVQRAAELGFEYTCEQARKYHQ
jgi:hypothetical protein